MVAADSKAKLLQEAERYVLQGKIQQAISEYLKIIQIDSNDVLILNTIGDLYLRRNENIQASKYFSRVAENYVKNNFFLKAIAVYKKILNADPNNIEVSLIMASLYAKQGLSIDARNQYLRAAALLEKGGRTIELLEVYEKIVELDPANTAIQRKLAELHAVEGAEAKAHIYWAGAARSQVRAGDLPGAVDSFRRAVQLSPLDVEVVRDYLECCLKMGNISPILDQLKGSVAKAPENLDMREMLGRALLANNDIDGAAKAFQVVVSMDESRYQKLLPIAQAYIDREEYDQALSSLDTVVPILISHRETECAVKLYESILQQQPRHIQAMVRLASIYSATGDQDRYLELLDEIADFYMRNESPAEALEYLEKIIRADPESERHRELHHQAFTEAYPDTPYIPPVKPHELLAESGSTLASRESGAAEDESPSVLVEADLLLNYGLREKALSLLLSQEARDPYDKEVRIRLLALYKAEKKYTEAAEQCLLLAALQRIAKNENSAQDYLAEARQLAPEMAVYVKDLDAFARRNGIVEESPVGAPSPARPLKRDAEVDLSADLMDIFFAGGQASMGGEDSEPLPIQEVIPDSYPQGASSQAGSKTMQEQLQEVDFYIRLGFHDEALTKLNEMAKINPNNPELVLRYQRLDTVGQTEYQESTDRGISHRPAFAQTDTIPSNGGEDFQQLMAEDNAEIPAGQKLETLSNAVPAAKVVPFRPAKPNVQVNEMFADLMEEVGSPAHQAAEKASFEEHFSLGTAYRDMDLIDDAIQEFQTALRAVEMLRGDPRVIQCCGMLSTCFLKKNMPRSALRWCQTGLGIADISSHESLALRYDMAVAHLMAGSNERALECFDQIFNIDPTYRDVAQRIDELKGGFERHAP